MIETKPFHLIDARQFTETISLELPDAPSISANTQRIDVRVEINEQIRTRQFLNIPCASLPPNTGATISLVPDTINLTISGHNKRSIGSDLKT